MPGILYALKSRDVITGKPLSCKIGKTSRTLEERQQELSQSREAFSVKIGVENVNIPAKREALVKLLLKEICPGRWYYSDTKLEFLHHRAKPQPVLTTDSTALVTKLVQSAARLAHADQRPRPASVRGLLARLRGQLWRRGRRQRHARRTEQWS